MKIEAPFVDEISVLAIVKMLDSKELFYNILLLINCYIGSIAISTMTKTMNNIGILHGYFIRSLGHCISP